MWLTYEGLHMRRVRTDEAAVLFVVWRLYIRTIGLNCSAIAVMRIPMVRLGWCQDSIAVRMRVSSKLSLRARHNFGLKYCGIQDTTFVVFVVAWSSVADPLLSRLMKAKLMIDIRHARRVLVCKYR